MNYEVYAADVVSQYNISKPQIHFIRHNENITYKITDGLNSKSYLLRIHTPITKGLTGVQHTLEGLNSEIQLLQYLNGNQSLKAQRPVSNYKGQYVVPYIHQDIPSPCYATLLEWIEGSTLTLKEDNLEDIVFAIGEKLAVFHEASRLFKPEKGFVRPVYDMKRLETAIRDLYYGVEAGIFSLEQYQLMQKTADMVMKYTKDLDTSDNAWGIVHADIQCGNIVIHNGEPCFIDFCLSGYSYYLFDLGSAATILEAPLRNTLFRGYASKTSFSFNDIKYIECMVFADIFISYMLFIYDVKYKDWLREKIETLCSDICSKFVEGEEVFYIM
jgi:Ser/Thr protein kinase RdoA (MazF antagonist)